MLEVIIVDMQLLYYLRVWAELQWLAMQFKRGVIQQNLAPETKIFD